MLNTRAKETELCSRRQSFLETSVQCVSQQICFFHSLANRWRLSFKCYMCSDPFESSVAASCFCRASPQRPMMEFMQNAVEHVVSCMLTVSFREDLDLPITALWWKHTTHVNRLKRWLDRIQNLLHAFLPSFSMLEQMWPLKNTRVSKLLYPWKSSFHVIWSKRAWGLKDRWERINR